LRMAGPDAESNFRLWWDRKHRRKKNALMRKANRLANCGMCGYLMFPRESSYAAITDLKKEGRRNLGEVRREIARNRIFQLARAPDAAVPNAA